MNTASVTGTIDPDTKGSDFLISGVKPEGEPEPGGELLLLY